MTTFETLKLLFMLLLITYNSLCSSETLRGNVTHKNTIKPSTANPTNKNLTKFGLKPNENVNRFETVEKKEKITLNWLIKAMKRSKRQHTSSAKVSHPQPFEMPSVPLPPPPPFPHNNFNISPFQSKSSTSSFNAGIGGVAAAGMPVSKSINPFTFKNQIHHQHSPATTASAFKCGGILKARHGVIHTPNFPHKFSTPIECVWIIDASDLIAHNGHNISIVVYLTQLYVLGGLKFTEYMYYSDDYKVPAHRVFTLTEDDVTQVAWVQFNSQYLEIRFRMSSLDGTHLRALDRLLDVYGFNMTYDVDTVKDYQCNTLQCRFLGHCYARKDFSSYYCSCFPGFSGVDCGRGPLCEDPHTNICQNGGTCKHIGDAAITCHCPNGYKGTKCEIPDISDITMGCTSNSSASDCHKECDFDNGKDGGISLLKTSRTSARSGKTRYEVTIRLGANLTAFYRNVDGEQKAREHLPTFLEKHVSIIYKILLIRIHRSNHNQ